MKNKGEKIKHKFKIENAYARKCQCNMVKYIYSFIITLKII